MNLSKIIYSLLFVIFFLLTMVLFNNHAIACTSFAVYASDTLYAMNFDFPVTELRFSIRTYGQYKYFRMHFDQQGVWRFVTGMNENGQMSTTQMVSPAYQANLLPGETPWIISDCASSYLSFYEDVPMLQTYIDTSNTRLTQPPVFGLHVLLADKNGNAIVAETGADSNMYTYPDSNFLVMTNFNNHLFWGQHYTQVAGSGAERYKTAYSYISQNITGFSLEDCIQVLNLTKQSSGSYPTICSFVFDPDSSFIYIMLNRNFNQIFRASLNEEYIETYSGFTYYSRINIDTTDVLSSQLQSIMGISDDADFSPNKLNLLNNYPNPFNPSTTITYRLQTHDHIVLKIYDVLGHEVSTLVNEKKSAGEHKIEWNAQNYPSGIYYYRLKVGNEIHTKRMLLLK